MKKTLAYELGDIAALAQQQFQQQYLDIDPIIGINSQLRKQGFAIDILTIDCYTNKKRVTILLDDAKPTLAGYQFSFTDKDPESDFITIAVSELNQAGFYDLMCKGLLP